MKSIFFISDAHLGFDNESVEANRIHRLLHFLQYVEKKGKMLIINGDLFDFWFEYRSVIPRKYFNILLSLKRETMVFNCSPSSEPSSIIINSQFLYVCVLIERIALATKFAAL